MKKYVRCKVCGFIMEEKNLKDVCPACGVPKTAFVEFKYGISEKRQQVLSLHLHPISVHFPEAIAVFLAGFICLAFITSGKLSNDLIIVNKVLSIIFPITIIVASITGIYDAKVRFKKLSPPYLKIKIYLGILLFVSSILTLVFLQSSSYSNAIKTILVILAFINLGTSTLLGKIGGTLIDSKMPG
ncbi:MAG: rubredoxin-type Fe(Cys)4 protein [Clostridiaceae bacterium]|nr:rubredoxin-type Fe(Cys)4 protein [Clostridiaceae bacterium]